MTLPKTIPLVEKRAERPMGLCWRPITNGEEDALTAYEAEMWFGGIAGSPGEKDGTEDMEGMLTRCALVQDMSMYFLYEATDALLRVDNCKLGLDFIVLNMIPAFYKGTSQLQRLNELFENQPVDKSRLVLTVPQAVVYGANKNIEEILKRYLKNGIKLMLDGWDPAIIPLDKVNEYGFEYLRPKAELYMKSETAGLFTALCATGKTVVAGSANDHETVRWLYACGIRHMSGTYTGNPVDEDELIHDCLLRERENG